MQGRCGSGQECSLQLVLIIAPAAGTLIPCSVGNWRAYSLGGIEQLLDNAALALHELRAATIREQTDKKQRNQTQHESTLTESKGHH